MTIAQKMQQGMPPDRPMCNGGGSSSSSSSNATTTENTDKRIVVETGMGISSDSSTINVQTVDAGIVNSALDVIRADDATNGQGFAALLTLADKLFTGAGQVVAKTQDTALGQIAALNASAAEAKGTVDNKTIVVVAVVAAAAWAFRKAK